MDNTTTAIQKLIGVFSNVARLASAVKTLDKRIHNLRSEIKLNHL